MASTVKKTSSHVYLREFRRQLLWKWAQQFDGWAERVATYRQQNRYANYRDRLEGKSSHGDEFVWELANLCRDFITGDLWSWAISRRMNGMLAEQIAQQLPERSKVSQAETINRKWNAGLGVLGGGLAISSSPTRAWAAVVTDAMPSFINETVIPALARRSAVDVAATGGRSPQALANRNKIDKFIQRVLRDEGRKLTRLDIWLLAGYGRKTSTTRQTPTEIYRFQRNDPSLAKAADQAIKRVLRTPSSTIAKQLSKVRARWQ